MIYYKLFSTDFHHDSTGLMSKVIKSLQIANQDKQLIDSCMIITFVCFYVVAFNYSECFFVGVYIKCHSTYNISTLLLTRRYNEWIRWFLLVFIQRERFPCWLQTTQFHNLWQRIATTTDMPVINFSKCLVFTLLFYPRFIRILTLLCAAVRKKVTTSVDTMIPLRSVNYFLRFHSARSLKNTLRSPNIGSEKQQHQ